MGLRFRVWFRVYVGSSATSSAGRRLLQNQINPKVRGLGFRVSGLGFRV